MNSRLTLLFLFLLVVQGISAQEFLCRIHDHKSVPRERWVDFDQAVIDIEINPYEKLVKGSVELSFTVLREKVDSLWLDGPRILIDSVFLDGVKLRFKSFDKGLALFPDDSWKRGENHQLEIFYKAQPKKGMYFTGWDDASGKTPKQVWTQGQGIDNRHWFPHFDDLSDKLLTETIITFDTGFSILSNGTLQSTKIEGGKQRVHYAMQKPHSSYLVMLAIGDYGVDSVVTASGTPIRNWYYNSEENKSDPTYRGTRELMEFLENYTGVSYPWESYSQVPVHDFLYGAMENTTATIFSDKYYVDSVEYKTNNYVYVNAHEMAHQWFGNLITSGSVEGHWLHEGFATYFHTLWQGEFIGEEEGLLLAESNRQMALQAGLIDDYPITDSRAGSSRHYMKAATVLRMLRDEVGEECFKASINHFLEKHAYQTVYTHDFLRSFNEVCGRSMDAFFNQWVYRGKEPNVSIEVVESDKEEKGTFLTFSFDSSSIELPFVVRVPIALKEKNALKECVYHVTGDTIIHVSEDNRQKVEWVEVDADRHLLVNWTWKNKPTHWLENQALTGTSIFSRADAISELSKKSALNKSIVNSILTNEKSDYVLSKLIEAKPKGILDKDLIELLGRDGFSRTKQAVLKDYPSHVEVFAEEFEYALVRWNNLELQWFMVALIREKFPLDDELRVQLEKRVTPYQELQLYFYQYELQLGNSDALMRMVELTHSSVDFNVRIDAFQVLLTLGFHNAELYENLRQALTSFNRRLKSGAKSAVSKTLTTEIVDYLEKVGESELALFYKNL